jgi:hypothetical protein
MPASAAKGSLEKINRFSLRKIALVLGFPKDQSFFAKEGELIDYILENGAEATDEQIDLLKSSLKEEDYDKAKDSLGGASESEVPEEPKKKKRGRPPKKKVEDDSSPAKEDGAPADLDAVDAVGKAVDSLSETIEKQGVDLDALREDVDAMKNAIHRIYCVLVDPIDDLRELEPLGPPPKE